MRVNFLFALALYVTAAVHPARAFADFSVPLAKAAQPEATSAVPRASQDGLSRPPQSTLACPCPAAAAPCCVAANAVAPDGQAANYVRLMARADREGKPLIVYVGVEAREMPGTIVVRWDAYGDGSPRIVVGLPGRGPGGSMGGFHLPAAATDASIAATAFPPAAFATAAVAAPASYRVAPAQFAPAFNSSPCAGGRCPIR